MSFRQQLVTVTLVWMLIPSAGAATDCAPLSTTWPGEQSANFINLVSSVPYNWITGAANTWNQACDVDQVPFFDVSGSHNPNDFNVNINYIGGRNPNPPVNGLGGGCGRAGFTNSGSMLASAVIEIYDQDYAGGSCNQENTLAHELGQYSWSWRHNRLSLCEQHDVGWDRWRHHCLSK